MKVNRNVSYSIEVELPNEDVAALMAVFGAAWDSLPNGLRELYYALDRCD